MKSTIWPGKHGPEKFRDSSPLLAVKTQQGVMKVVNIVSPKCRLLASRERCPFLVHCEVLETGLEGSDARLYSNGEDDIGATLQEVMGFTSGKMSKDDNTQTSSNHNKFPSYHIPPEISPMNNQEGDSALLTRKLYDCSQDVQKGLSVNRNTVLLRGGDQYGYTYPNMQDSGSFSSSPYDLVKEEQLQRLHEHLQFHQQHPHYGPREPSIPYPATEDR